MSSKTLVAGTHKLLNNNGTVRFINANTDTMTVFPKGWAADGIRKSLRDKMPGVGSSVTIEQDIVVEGNAVALK